MHRIPELDFDLPKTRSYLLSVLEPLGCEIRDLGRAGFTAYFNRNKSETIAFRSDMDAIPIPEPPGSSFASEHGGVMHACGHDGHMSMILGLAEMIAADPEKMACNCLLVFEAAEETSGGAEPICCSGVLKEYGVSRIYGLHLWPGYPAHTIICKPCEFMAGTTVLTVTIDGQSAHIVEHKKGLDALEAGALLITRAYEFERSLPADELRILRFGSFHSGTANNIISGKTVITGAFRAFSNETFSRLNAGLEKIIHDIEKETGVRFTFEKSEGYPPVVNPFNICEQAKADTLRIFQT